MSPEDWNRKMELLLNYQAEFAIRQDRDHEMLVKGFDVLTRDVAGLRESTARFQAYAAELITIQSSRLDRQDEFYRDALRQSESFQRQAINLLHMILDRLPPAPMRAAT